MKYIMTVTDYDFCRQKVHKWKKDNLEYNDPVRTRHGEMWFSTSMGSHV